MDLDIKTIYINLLDEGIEVVRPVKAHKIRGNIYKILENEHIDCDDEIWEFPRNSIIECKINRKGYFVAYKRV